jgi:hypothetical protein
MTTALPSYTTSGDTTFDWDLNFLRSEFFDASANDLPMLPRTYRKRLIQIYATECGAESAR